MQRVACAAFEMATNHPVVVFDVPDGRLDGLSAFELGSKQLVHRFDAPPVHRVNAGVVRIHTPIAQIDERLFHGSARAPSQRIALSNLCGQGVPIKRIARKALGPTIKPCLWVMARLSLTPNS